MKNNRTFFFLKILSTVPIFIFVDNINVTMSLICTSVVQINSTETTYLTLSVYDFVTGFDLQSKVPKRAELCRDKQTPSNTFLSTEYFEVYKLRMPFISFFQVFVCGFVCLHIHIHLFPLWTFNITLSASCMKLCFLSFIQSKTR